MLNVSRPTVNRWESGARKVDDDKLQEVSQRTGIPPAELRPDLVELLQVPEGPSDA